MSGLYIPSSSTFEAYEGIWNVGADSIITFETEFDGGIGLQTWKVLEINNNTMKFNILSANILSNDLEN